MKGLVPYKTILAAKRGDPEAMIEVLHHYRGYINHFSRREYETPLGGSVFYVDDEIRQRIESKLMYAIVFRFDPDGCPSDK